jgi:SNF2 family DNA or RNA helicase
VLTTYALLTRDREELITHAFHIVILDEAQFVKNPRAKAGQVARQLNTRHRLCLTGTPLENHLGELWSLFDFLMPGLLGTQRQFQRHYRTPIEKRGDTAVSSVLARRIRPFLLRRTKDEVLSELPAKNEICLSVDLQGAQRELYEGIRVAVHQQIRQAIQVNGIASSQIVILDALLKLRQVCCDPRLVKLEQAAHVRESAKLALLMEMLPEMIEEGRRILLFSQFTSMLKLIEQALEKAGIDYVKLTGQTRDRETPVVRFQDGAVPLFLISLKAGGTGLNLTASDTVIHYDPWWNPAVERQATDRAHRIGQEKTVFVYKLISEDTVEQKMLAMQDRKLALAEQLYEAGASGRMLWTEEELDKLFAPLPV